MSEQAMPINPSPDREGAAPGSAFRGPTTVSRARLRGALLAAGGVVGAGRLATHPSAPIAAPFGRAEPVEGDRVRAVAVTPVPSPTGVAFLDGIQRYALVGRFGLAPVIRGYVAAAALEREDGKLRLVAAREEEFLVAPLARLSDSQCQALEDTGLVLHDCPAGERPHPLLDVQLAVQVVERRREMVELAVAEATLTPVLSPIPKTRTGGWLVVDGPITGLGRLAGSPAVIGVVKSHETQFLEGRDLEVALTLRFGERSTVFARATAGGTRVYTWYLRLWPWDEEDLTYGLVRVERAPAPATVEAADLVSGWLVAERVPLSAPDARWDRLLYPIHMVENFLRARAGALGGLA